MSTIKVAHIADVHLRTQQYGYKSRGYDFFSGFRNAVQACIDAGADCILCSGDLFDTTSPASTLVVDQLAEVDAMLRAKEIEMIVSPGNHDGNTPHWASIFNKISTGRGGVRVPNASAVVTVESKDKDAVVSVTALPWMTPTDLRTELEVAPKATILMWHGEIKEFTGYPKPDAIEVADFPSGKWQLIAMGDQHVHKMVKREDGLVVAYPGSTESCSSAEEHDKKAYMYTFSCSGDTTVLKDISDVPFETRPKQKLELHTEEDVERACENLISGSLVYCHYNRNLKNVRNRLIAAAVAKNMDVPTITMTSFIEKMGSTTVQKFEHTSAVMSPGQYVHANAAHYFGEADRERLTSLSVTLLTPGMSVDDALARFCKEEIES